jgi:hypothetical protein
VTADNIVDGEYDTQGWNRFSYTKGNPIRYKDSTGHFVEELINLVKGDGWKTNNEVQAAKYDKEMVDKYLVNQRTHRVQNTTKLCDISNCIGSSNTMALMSEGALKNKKELGANSQTYSDKYLDELNVPRDHPYEGSAGRNAYPGVASDMAGSRNPSSSSIKYLQNSELGKDKTGNYSFKSLTSEQAEKYLKSEEGNKKVITMTMKNTGNGYEGHSMGVYYNPYSKEFKALDPLKSESSSLGESISGEMTYSTSRSDFKFKGGAFNKVGKE